MPPVQAVRAANASLSLLNPVAIFVGGTSGIGEHTAYKLAQYSKNPQIHIVGRKQDAANRVIEELRKINGDGAYTFHQCDVTSLSGLRTLAAKLRSDVPALNYLYLSPGILTTQGRTETADGNDIKMMLHLYSRMFLIRELVPSLRAAKGKGEEARVLSVLDSKRGNFDKLVWDDLELKKSYSLGNAGNHCITMNDIMIKEFSLKNPEVSFTHAFPGFVDTPIAASLAFPLRMATKAIMNVLGVSPQDCAEYMFNAMTRPESGKGSFYVDERANDIKGKKEAGEEQRKKVWDHVNEVVDRQSEP